MACLPARYKLVELLCYVVMGFFPALVVLSMVSPVPASVWTPGGCGSVQVPPDSQECFFWQLGKLRFSGSGRLSSKGRRTWRFTLRDLQALFHPSLPGPERALQPLRFWLLGYENICVQQSECIWSTVGR